MALYGNLISLSEQLPRPERIAPALAYLRQALTAGSEEHRRIQALAAGDTRRIELEEGCYAMEQAYQTKPWANGRFESHRAYIDIQAVVEGTETMGVADRDGLVATEDLTPEQDVIFYAGSEEVSRWRVAAGEIAVFFPADVHLPSVVWGEPGLVRKTVVKVPVERW
jgi:YhcH/YjgK/YiaL family protein